MSDVILVTVGVLAFVGFDQLQKRQVPWSYYEPLDLAYGVDSELNARKILFRFAFPILVGSLLGVCTLFIGDDNKTNPAVVAGCAGLLGCAMLVYPAFKDADMRPVYAKPLTRNTVLAYLSFVLANAVLASLGARLTLGAISTVAAIWVARAGYLTKIYRVWVTEHLPFLVQDSVILALLLGFWRRLVSKMVSAWNSRSRT
jgi:hypothetical protein